MMFRWTISEIKPITKKDECDSTRPFHIYAYFVMISRAEPAIGISFVELFLDIAGKDFFVFIGHLFDR